MLRRRGRKGVHEIPFIRKKIFAEPEDIQVQPGDYKNGNQRNDVSGNQHHVHKPFPHAQGVVIVVYMFPIHNKLNVKASDNGNDHQSQVQRDHQPVHGSESML